MDKEQMSKPAQPWEFRSKPAWQRLLVMVAGVLMNFILAIIIYAGIAWYWGENISEIPRRQGRHGVCTVGKGNRIRDGDIPLLADGEEMYASDPSVCLKW